MWFGLKQSGKIAHDDLVQHLNKHRYVQAKNTDVLCVHGICDIFFTLVVDDFGIKCTNKDNMDHPIFLMPCKIVLCCILLLYFCVGFLYFLTLSLFSLITLEVFDVVKVIGGIE